MSLKWVIFIGMLFSLSAFSKTQNQPPLQKQPEETATFSAGCFWGVQEFFRKLPGVKETRVGYTGGTTKNPSYEDVSTGMTGHAESIEIKFDPSVISYEKLLDLFFKLHDPTTLNRQGNDTGSQYRSAIFYHSEEQKRIAENYKSKVEKSGAWKAPIVTEIVTAGPFYPAEEYHQDYLEKHPFGYDNHYLRKISFDPGTASPR
jgi:methionine-S-sulfoxide reductase